MEYKVQNEHRCIGESRRHKLVSFTVENVSNGQDISKQYDQSILVLRPGKLVGITLKTKRN